MRKVFALLPLALCFIGCDTGDVPTEEVPVTTVQQPQNTPAPTGQPQSTGEALRENSSLPPAAKEALLGKTGR